MVSRAEIRPGDKQATDPRSQQSSLATTLSIFMSLAGKSPNFVIAGILAIAGKHPGLYSTRLLPCQFRFKDIQYLKRNLSPFARFFVNQRNLNLSSKMQGIPGSNESTQTIEIESTFIIWTQPLHRPLMDQLAVQ